MKDIEKIRELVGDISSEDLKYVECSVADNLGIFIPNTGYCNYAITPQHTHPGYMFNLFTAPEHCIIEQKLDVPANNYLAVALSPQIPHEEKTEDSFKRYYAIIIASDYFEKEYHSYTKSQPPEYFWEQFLVSSDIMFYIKQFTYEYENDSGNSQKMLESLSLLITNKLIRSLLNIENITEPIPSVFEIEKAEQYMHQNFGKKLTDSNLAELANMSVSHFIRVFKRETGISPMEYLMRVRIEKAKKYLMSNDKTITEIALICGFSSNSHFSSSFQKQTGQTPTDYRKIYSVKNFETK